MAVGMVGDRSIPKPAAPRRLESKCELCRKAALANGDHAT